MGHVTITGVERCDSEGTTLRLSVRGCEVLAVFPNEENQEVSHKIRKVLIDTCISNLSCQNKQKNGQKKQNMR